MGNILNRVFDSSGPEGKVRGTPQQVIDKYNQLARDAQLSGDRVATENFQQHAEHYTRLLSAAQKEAEMRRDQQERERQQNRQNQSTDGAAEIADENIDKPAIGLVETPEANGGDYDIGSSPETSVPEKEDLATSAPKKPSRSRRPRAKAPAPDAAAEMSEVTSSSE